MEEIKNENNHVLGSEGSHHHLRENAIERPKPHHPKPKKTKLNHWKIATAVLAILLVVSIYTSFGSGDGVTGAISMNAAATKTIDFVNTNLLQGQAVAELTAVDDTEGLYNVKLSIDGQLVDGYVTKNGNLFFPQAINLNDEITDSAPTQATTPEVVKSDKPKVELFVMSHCPYGTQAEKGILPVVDELGDKIDFELKFVYYAMHGELEINEQSKQVCIQREYPKEFNDYLKCFLEVGDAGASKCMSGLGIKADVVADCEAELDADFGITAALEDQSSWLSGRFPLFNVHKTENELYQVGGSPTLIINGQQVSSGRAPAQYLTTICAAFNDAPEECEAELNTQSYGPGFGYEGVGSDVAAACGA